MSNIEPAWWSAIPASVPTDVLSNSVWQMRDGTATSNPYLLRLRQPGTCEAGYFVNAERDVTRFRG